MAYFNRLFGNPQDEEQNQQNNAPAQPAQLFQLNNSSGAAGFSPGGGMAPRAAAPAAQNNMNPTRSGMRFVNSQRYFEQNPNQDYATKIANKAGNIAGTEKSANEAANSGIYKYANDFSHPQDVNPDRISQSVGNLFNGPYEQSYKDSYDYLSNLLNVQFSDPGSAQWNASKDFTKTSDLYKTGASNDAGKNNIIRSFASAPSAYTGGELALDRLLYGSDTKANDAIASGSKLLGDTAADIKTKNDATNTKLGVAKSTEAANAEAARKQMTGILDANKDSIGMETARGRGDPRTPAFPVSSLKQDEYFGGGKLYNPKLEQYRTLAKLLGVDPSTINVNQNIADEEYRQAIARDDTQKKNQENAMSGYYDRMDDRPWLDRHAGRARGI